MWNFITYSKKLTERKYTNLFPAHMNEDNHTKNYNVQMHKFDKRTGATDNANVKLVTMNFL